MRTLLLMGLGAVLGVAASRVLRALLVLREHRRRARRWGGR